MMRLVFLLLCCLFLGHSFTSAQVQLTFSIAPAPGPDALASASAEQPDRPEVVAPIEPVSTPILTAIEPIVGNFMNNAKTIAQDVRSGVDGIKSAVPEIANSFNGRKLLTDARSKRLRTTAGTASLKRLQAHMDEQKGSVQAAAADSQAQPADAQTVSQLPLEDEDARIERELVQMKEDRLKAIQALPRSVWQ